MGKISSIQSLSNVTDWANLTKWVSQFASSTVNIVNGGLTFSDNFTAQQIQVTFNGANQTITVPHTLGFVPNGYIEVQKSAALIVFDGNQTNTANKLFVQANSPGTATLLIY